MLSEDEIRDLEEHYINNLYSKVRGEQRTDMEYRDDTFLVPEVRTPHKLWRSGIGARMVDAPAEQIVTSNPQVFFEMMKGKADTAKKLSKEVNQNWIETLRLENPNPFKEDVKNKLSRGESYIRLAHNEMWVTNPTGKDKKGFPIFRKFGMPVLFLTPDPMVIYGSPEEDDSGWIPNTGVPNRVIIEYQRQYSDVIVRYKNWSNPKGKKPGGLVQWKEFWDKDTMQLKADGVIVLRAKNPYGFTPFIRKYSGFGRRSPDGELAELIVGDIRFSRDLIKQECITRSNIASIEHIFAHRPKTIMSEGTLSSEQLQALNWGAYDLNIIDNVPIGTKFIEEQYPAVPPEMYQNLANIRAELAQRNPFIMAGLPFGTSGRQQSLTETAAGRRYSTVLENTEVQWATAIHMALVIAARIPGLAPSGLSESELLGDFRVAVELAAADPIDDDRKANLGASLFEKGQIDSHTNLTKYQGYTTDEADEIDDNLLAAKVLGSDAVIAILGQQVIEEAGMADQLAALQESNALAERSQQRTSRPSEVQTERGREELDNLNQRPTRRGPTEG